MTLPKAPVFFVSYASTEEDEQAYCEFARVAQRSVPELGNRIYSITFKHDGEQWTATVGQPMSGTVKNFTKVGGRRVESTVLLGNRSTILAIFPGNPFVVWHDGASSIWQNPFYAGTPTSITPFAM